MVPAGSNSATFAVTTSAISATTAVTISATYSGATLNAQLTVQPGTLQAQTITFAALPGRTYGDPPFTVSATASSGLPVSFTVGATDNCSISGTTITITGAGTCTVTAHQPGSSSYSPAPDVPQTFAIAQATAAVVLTSSLNPSAYGQSVTFTATVSSSAGTPTGSVTFYDGSTSLGTGALSSGTAALAISSLSAATHTITATYGGGGNFQSGTSPALSQVVNRANTITTLTSSLNPSTYGRSVTLTATVRSSAGTPTGSVTFYDGATALGTGTLSNGTAALAISGLSAATHTITATYGGSGNFQSGTSSALSQVVNRAATTTTLISSPDPSVFAPGRNLNGNGQRD